MPTLPSDKPIRYPTGIRDFVTYYDQPPDSTKTLTDSKGVVWDLTVDYANITNDIHAEIMAIETAIGSNPFQVPNTRTMGQSITWLWGNRSPIVHHHYHWQSVGLNRDDHAEYMRTDGARAFTGGVASPPATNGNHLIRWDQAQGHGVTSSAMQNIANNTLQDYLTANGQQQTAMGTVSTVAGNYKLMGGFTTGYTDDNGLLWVPFGNGFKGVLTFVWMKNPFPGLSHFGYYAFQYEEDQLILASISNQGAMVQFIEDIVVDRKALVAMTWMAVGV